MQQVGPPPAPRGLDPERWPLFCTLGRRRRDGSYTDPGRRCGYNVVAKLVERHGAAAHIEAGCATPTCSGIPALPATWPAPATWLGYSGCLATPTSAPRCATSTWPATSCTSESSTPSLVSRSRSTSTARRPERTRALLVSRCRRRSMLAMPPPRLRAGHYSSGCAYGWPVRTGRRGAPRAPRPGRRPRAPLGGSLFRARAVSGVEAYGPASPSIARRPLLPSAR
jgi:hypothetical protein